MWVAYGLSAASFSSELINARAQRNGGKFACHIERYEAGEHCSALFQFSGLERRAKNSVNRSDVQKPS